jgi:hypothetical protein
LEFGCLFAKKSLNIEMPKFVVTIDESKFNRLVTRSKKFKILIKHNCYCLPEKPDTIYEYDNGVGKTIKIKDVVTFLKKKYKPSCAHKFMEDIKRRKNKTFEIIFGS